MIPWDLVTWSPQPTSIVSQPGPAGTLIWQYSVPPNRIGLVHEITFICETFHANPQRSLRIDIGPLVIPYKNYNLFGYMNEAETVYTHHLAPGLAEAISQPPYSYKTRTHPLPKMFEIFQPEPYRMDYLYGGYRTFSIRATVFNSAEGDKISVKWKYKEQDLV